MTVAGTSLCGTTPLPNGTAPIFRFMFVRWLRNYQATAGADLSAKEQERHAKEKAEYDAKKAHYKSKYGKAS